MATRSGMITAIKLAIERLQIDVEDGEPLVKIASTVLIGNLRAVCENLEQMEAQPAGTAPENRRVLVYGDHGEGKHDEMAMGWLDRLDGRWYYAPQGGLIQWRVKEWMPVPEPEAKS